MTPSRALTQTCAAQRELVGHLRAQSLHLRIREETAQIGIAFWRTSQKADDWRNAPVLERGYVADHGLHFPNLPVVWHPHVQPSTDGAMNPRAATMRPRIPGAGRRSLAAKKAPGLLLATGTKRIQRAQISIRGEGGSIVGGTTSVLDLTDAGWQALLRQ